MAKPKSPLLSLEAQGTIGDALTYQRRGQDTIVRQKPIPKDPYSLNQAYQRWDYRDYAYLWTLLTNSEKQVYRTKASRYHITGFSQFMRENLKDLTNIVGRWHLDEKSGAIAYDSSKQGNNGVIIGASPAAGLIDGGFHFDGLNDTVNLGNSPSVRITGPLSIALFINPTTLTSGDRILERVQWGPRRGYYIQLLLPTTIGFYLHYNNAIYRARYFSLSLDIWTHIVGVFDPPRIKIYAGGLLQKDNPGPPSIDDTDPTKNLTLGSHDGTSNYFDGLIDHVSLYSRALDTTEILRLSQRRYPA